MPEVSVVIPSYNHEAYITEAVNSVLDQTLDDLEIIVVDDGSTDRSLEVLADISNSRMRVISQVNQGAHFAINRGLGEASGEFLAILNSDDTYHPQRLEIAIAALKAHPQAGFAGSYIQIIDSQGNNLSVKHGYQDNHPWLLQFPERSFRAGDDLRSTLLTENFWSTTSNFVFARQVYQQTGQFRPLRFAHDWDYALRVSQTTPMLMLPEPLVRYRVHPGNTIRENQAAMIFEICWVLAMHLPQHTADEDFISQLPLAQRVEQLLNSIYTFGMERVLSVMLIQRLHENLDLAFQLLDPNNPVRQSYLDFIQLQLTASEGTDSSTASIKSRLKRRLGRLRFPES
jgi:glycosyltransferase involved in cell wall biosynthesis